jgi:hypothetical protein
VGPLPPLTLGFHGPRLPAWALVLLVSWSCFAPPPRSGELPLANAPAAPAAPAASAARPVASEKATSAVVLVVLDGVRWQEVFLGVDPELGRRQGLSRDEFVGASQLMPRLHEVLIGHGAAIGAPGYGPEMRASGPNYVSLPGYTEILTGRTATRCQDNACPKTDLPTVADEVALLSPPGARDRAAVISSWESLEQAASSGSGDVLVSAGRHGGHGFPGLEDASENVLFDEAARASSAPGQADFRPDHYTAEIALHYLATERPRFLFIGLGEPDEYAHQNNYRAYLDSLRAADRTLGKLVETLALMGERGRETSIFVTTDHGRSSAFRDHGGFAPESGRVWLVASGGKIAQKGLVHSEEPHRLADIAPTMRLLLGAAPDTRQEAGRVIHEVLSL